MKRALAIATLLGAANFLAPHGTHAQTPPRDPPPHSFGERLQVEGIRNAAKVSAQLYRGAQPHAEGLPELQKLGITTIVDLRRENKEKIAWEKKTSEGLGMQFVHIPVSGWSAPSDAQVAQFLALFRDHPEAKVFVHCHYGDDRTGVFVAAYRMVFDKFSTSEAIQEMDRFGFNRPWHPAMRAYVSAFPEHLDSSPALAPFHNQH